MLFTRDESRNTDFAVVQVAVSAQGSHHQKPPSGPLHSSPRHCFPVHDCSRLFGIVQQKILPLSQCLLSVLTGNTAFNVLHESRDTRHGTRLICFSRITRRESRPLWPFGSPWERKGGEKSRITKTAARSLLPCARSRGIARHRAARDAPSRRPRTVRISNMAFKVFHETRNTNHGLYRRPDRCARRHITTSLRMLTGPFRDILVFCRLNTVFTES